MGKVTLKGNVPVLEMIYMRGPICILKVGDRQLEFVRANRMQGKFYQTPEGVFELDAEYEYQCMGNAVYIYNLYNSKPISLQGVEKIQKLYRSDKAKEITRELDRIKTALKEALKDKLVDPLVALKEIYEKKDSDFDNKTLKFIVDHKTFDKDDLKLLNLSKMTAKYHTQGSSYRIYTTGPILLLSLVGISVVVTMRFFNPLKIFPGLGNSLINNLSILPTYLEAFL